MTTNIHPESLTSMSSTLELAADLIRQIRLLKRLYTPAQWTEHMNVCGQVVRGRMAEKNLDNPLSAAAELATELQADSKCPPTLPLLMLARGVELATSFREWDR